MANLYTLERAKWTTAKRKQYLKDHPENHAGPAGSFPIEDASDVNDAWRLAGHADNPDAVRAKIKSIAKRLGLESGLPDTATEDDKQERAAMGLTPPVEHGVTEDSTQDDRRTLEPHNEQQSMTHPPMTGTHAHPHMHADGSTANHSHEHREDNHHEHADYQPNDIPRSLSAVSPFAMYLPITRSDSTQRTVYGQATVEQPDAYKTIFGYCPEAWKQWRGNIREQHDPKKAVGKAISVECDEQERAIYVGSKISRGAQDTWLKVEDNVLTGYSASIIPDPEFGNDISKWPRKEYNGKQYPYLPRYSVVELSLVDNPATPGCNISIVRANGFITDVLDNSDIVTPTPEPATAPQPIERAGVRVSAATQGVMHEARDFTMQAFRKMLDNCGCDDCGTLAKYLDPDMDGDIDMPASMPDKEQEIKGQVDRALQPAFVRLQALAGEFARRNTSQHSAIEALTAKVDSLASVLERALQSSSQPEWRAELSAVKEAVERIANQPAAGGPVLNGQGIAKSLPNSPYMQAQPAEQAVLDRLAASGAFDTLDKQVAAAALAVRPMYGNQRG